MRHLFLFCPSFQSLTVSRVFVFVSVVGSTDTPFEWSPLQLCLLQWPGHRKKDIITEVRGCKRNGRVWECRCPTSIPPPGMMVCICKALVCVSFDLKLCDVCFGRRSMKCFMILVCGKLQCNRLVQCTYMCMPCVMVTVSFDMEPDTSLCLLKDATDAMPDIVLPELCVF